MLILKIYFLILNEHEVTLFLVHDPEKLKDYGIQLSHCQKVFLGRKRSQLTWMFSHSFNWSLLRFHWHVQDTQKLGYYRQLFTGVCHEGAWPREWLQMERCQPYAALIRDVRQVVRGDESQCQNPSQPGPRPSIASYQRPQHSSPVQLEVLP